MKRILRPSAPLLFQLLTLTGLTLIAAWAISALLLFLLPPPAPDFYRLSEIEQTFRGSTPTFAERRPLTLSTLDRPPQPELEGSSIPQIRLRIARDMDVAVTRVVIAGLLEFNHQVIALLRICQR